LLNIDKEFQSIIPPLSKEEYIGLKQSIIAEGCRESLIVWDNTIIDGHNRFEICTKHDIEYKTTEHNFNDRTEAICWIIDNQLGRRNISKYDQYILKYKKADILRLEGKAKQGYESNSVLSVTDKTDIPHNTQKIIADELGWSTGQVAQAEVVRRKASPEVKKQLSSKEITINKAYTDIKKEERQANIQQQIEDIESGKAELPEGLFEVINIDPPWNYGVPYDANGRRVASPYPEMNQDELKELNIPSAENSIMFLWTTHKFIWDAKELLETWGFNYRSLIVWDKEKIGMGDLFRMQCEFCLVGIKGKPVMNNNHTWRDIIRESRREHSRKPELFYSMVNELCVGRKLDYFSRAERDGWEVFGNDASKF